jgi:ketosteroid isomerase-like protein
MVKRILILVLFAIGFGANCQQKPVPQSDLWAITKDYLKAFEEINFEKMGTFLHDSVSFFDINTSAVGKQAVIQNWKNSFNPIPTKIKFEIGEHFVTGSFVVVNLRYESVMKIQDKNTVVNIEVITVAQFKNDKIIFLHDYPDMNSFNRQLVNQVGGQLIGQNGDANIEVVSNFYKAYSDWDIPTMTSFYADNVEFKDLTAKEAFKGGNYEHSGKVSTTAFWAGIFGGGKPPYVNLTLNSAYASGDFVIANTTFSLQLPPSWTGGKEGVFVSIPIKTLLQVKNGKIVTHYDFADYNLYNQQISIQK